LHFSNIFQKYSNFILFLNTIFHFFSKFYFEIFGNSQIMHLNLYNKTKETMRHTIDKQTYKYLFGILMFFAVVLAIITGMLYIDLAGFAPKTLTFSASLFFMLIGISFWLRIEYLKHYNLYAYKARRVPMWFTAGASMIVGILILI
jgi:hypothetical protein